MAYTCLVLSGRMNRRTCLRSAAVVGAAAVAGCLDGVLGDDHAEGAILGPPEQDLSEVSHPTYGDEIPSFSVPDPLSDETIEPADFNGERAYLLTFVYTNCHDGSCPLLLSQLRYNQERAAEAGYEDDVAFLALTFDPERDTAAVLEQEANDQDVDLEAGNWHFLRPESNEDAAELVEETFGLPLDQEDLDSHEHAHDDEATDPDDEEYDILHYNLILLVNADGIVERAYPNATTIEWDEIYDDLETVVSEQ